MATQLDAILNIGGLKAQGVLTLQPGSSHHVRVLGGAIGSLWADTRTTGADAADYSQFRLARAGVPKWRVGNNLAGTGSDDFYVRREAESGGVTQLDVMKVTRATGRVDFSGDVYAAGVQLGAGGGGGSITPPVNLSASVAAAPIMDLANTASDGTGFKVRAQNTSRTTNQYALMVANAANDKRVFQIFAEETILQLGRTPEATQWPVASNSFSAPAGSGGPRRLPAADQGQFLFSESSAHIHFISNMAPVGGSATGGANQQADIGLVGANSLGRMRVARAALSSDGGFRIECNRIQLPTVTGSGTVAQSGTTLTVSVPDSIAVGQAIYVIDDLGQRNGVTVMSRTNSTTFVGNDTDSYTARAFEIEEGQQLDTNRGSGKFGTDSMGSFGVGMAPPLNATGTYAGSDFDIYFYTRGWNQAWNGTSPDRADIAVKRKGQSLGIVTGDANSSSNMRTSVVFQPWYDFGDSTAGNVEFYGQIRAQGGNANARAALFLKPQSADPDVSQIQNGDIWVNSTSNTLKVRLNGVTRTVTVT